MKKLIITLCLLVLCIALFNSRVYAAYIYNIDLFEQDNTVDDSNTFTDLFDGTDEPTGPEYDVFANFGTERQSGGRLELNSVDGIGLIGEKQLGVDVSNSTYYFSPSTGGHVKGKFGNFSNPDSFLGIGISNWITGFEDVVTRDHVFISISTALNGTPRAVWSDETQFEPLGFSEIGVAITDVTMELVIDTNNDVIAMWDYNSDGTWDKILDMSTITTLTLNLDETGEFYTGGFFVGEPEIPPIPEPATIALLGIGLAGLGGRYLRRKQKATVK